MIFSVRRSAEIIQYPLFNPNGEFNLQGFGARVMEEAKARDKLIILLNFPNNPTGYTISPSEGEGIADVLTHAAQGGTNIIAVVDDAYFGLVYEDDVLQESISSILIGRDPRLLTIKLDGATKESYGWALSPMELPAEDNTHSSTTPWKGKLPAISEDPYQTPPTSANP
jgi:aspartate/methionine/tyrosine aminotransferase